MKVLTQLDDVHQEFPNISVALGTFDGIHIGHQKIISKAVQLAKSMDGSSVVFTFSNHPLCIIAPDRCPLKIMSEQSKIQVLDALGVDVLISIALSREFLQLSPTSFIEKLVKNLKPAQLVVGPNYSFGYKGAGTPKMLYDFGAMYEFRANVLDAVYVGDTMVSSTVIRQMISDGAVDKALVLLGRPFSIDGKVIKGDGRGRLLGYPTANLAIPEDVVIPGDGVYAVTIDIGSKQYFGMANIGNNPTFDLKNQRLEIHVLDFAGDIYDKTIRVHFVGPIRKEIKFVNSKALQRQISLDVKRSEDILRKYTETIHRKILGFF